jgi:hypothetical protein
VVKGVEVRIRNFHLVTVQSHDCAPGLGDFSKIVIKIPTETVGNVYY